MIGQKQKWTKISFLVVVVLSAAGCSANPPEVFSNANQVVETPVAVTPKVATQVEASYGYGNDPALIKAYQQYKKTGQAPRVSTQGFISFPYDLGSQPIISCEPLHICTIEFQEGELIKDVSIGDSANWQAKPMFMGGTWPNGTEVLAIKPSIANVQTNIAITTDRGPNKAGRIYNLSLVSSNSSKYARLVTFYYPLDTDQDFEQAAQAAIQKKQTESQNVISTSTSLNLNDVNFNYSMSGDDPAWKPLRVFDDGKHTMIEFPKISSSMDLPALYVMTGGEKALVNYRKSGQYYVVDRIFKQAALISGVGRRQIQVMITNRHIDAS